MIQATHAGRQETSRATRKIHECIATEAIAVPADLADRVNEMLAEDPAMSWDQVVWKLAVQR